VEIRVIRPEEWELLKPIFAAEQGNMPAPDGATGIVAVDEKGIAGFWLLQNLLWAGPIWIRKDQRGTGLWRKLHAKLHALFTPKEGTGYYTFCGEPKVEHMLKELGYSPVPYSIWKREVGV
jgi:hypothetical protein